MCLLDRKILHYPSNPAQQYLDEILHLLTNADSYTIYKKGHFEVFVNAKNSRCANLTWYNIEVPSETVHLHAYYWNPKWITINCSLLNQVEDFGIARAWLAEEALLLLIESSEEQLSKLTASYMANTTSIGPGLEVLRILCK